jgi:hypothetical protein
MKSVLTVTTAASSYDLTTLVNVKAELGQTDGSSDVILKRYIGGASAAAMQYCNRVFAAESLSEQFLPDHASRLFRGGVSALQLSRWPIIAVTSVTEDSTLLVENTDYLVDKAAGQLTRLDSSGRGRSWSPLPLVVVYSAGYAVIPPDVEDAAIRMVSKRYSAKGRDPTLKAENIPGVLDRQFWIATGSDSGNMTPDITDVLDNYRQPLTA